MLCFYAYDFIWGKQEYEQIRACYNNMRWYKTVLNDAIMCIYSSVCIALKILDHFFSSLSLKFYYFCYALEGHKAPGGETAKENITPYEMWIPVPSLRCRKYIYYGLAFPQREVLYGNNCQ